MKTASLLSLLSLPPLLFALLLSVAALNAHAQAENSDSDDENAEDLRVLSYALGYSMGHQIGSSLDQMRAKPDDFAMDDLVAGVRDALSGSLPQYSQAQLQPVLSQWLEKQQELVQEEEAKMEADWEAESQKNLQAAREFLQRNKKAKKVKVTDSGLQYRIDKKGKGANPDADDWVRVHYKGTTLDGEEFDSSYSRNQPTTFSLDGVIAGWREGLQLLRPGGRATLYVPPDLGYGDEGPSSQLPFGPNSLLIFEIELLDVAASEAELDAKAQAAADAVASKNLRAAERFLAKNRSKKGVQETDSGLQYKILREGEGEQPEASDWVKVHYRGTTIKGKEFDSSYGRGDPAVFPLQGVIAGWTEGLQKLRRNAKAMLYVPPDLGYGNSSRPDSVFGPNSLLIFEVELIDFAASRGDLAD